MNNILPPRGATAAARRLKEAEKIRSGKGADGLTVSPVSDAQIDASHGYSFSQAEGGGELSQAQVIRMYNTRMGHPQT